MNLLLLDDQISFVEYRCWICDRAPMQPTRRDVTNANSFHVSDCGFIFLIVVVNVVFKCMSKTREKDISDSAICFQPEN